MKVFDYKKLDERFLRNISLWEFLIGHEIHTL